MSLSARELARVVEELRPHLLGAAVRHVVQPDDWSVVLTVRRDRRDRHLLVTCRPGLSRVHFLDSRPGSGSRASAADKEDRTHRSPGEGAMPAVPGAAVPPAAARPVPPGAPPTAFCMLLRKHLWGARIRGLDQPGGDRLFTLLLGRSGSSGEPVAATLAAELTGRHGNLFLLDAEGRILGSIGPNRSVRRDNRPGMPYTPPLPTPAPLPGASVDRFAGQSLLEVLPIHYREAEERADVAALKGSLRRQVKSHLQRATRLRENLRGDLGRIEEAARFRRFAEAILCGLGSLRKGMTEALLPDWHAPGASPIAVPLDPALSPKENAERYFRQYRRYAGAREEVSARLAEAEGAIARWEDILEEVDAAQDRGTLQAVAARAGLPLSSRPADHRSGGPGRRSPGGTPPTPRLPYHEFLARNGRDRILVGRGGEDNDRLTFTVARGNDVWLHVRDLPGPHVVVRQAAAGEISTETLLDAATLAAHFCRRARAEGRCEVAWTHQKYVRRIPGAAPGRVQVLRARTLRIDIEEDRLRRLLTTRKGASVPDGT